jgi:hypothetical protein
MILSAIHEELMQKKKARQALRYMHYPSSIHYLAGDEINRPQRKRSARWAYKNSPVRVQRIRGRLRKKLKQIIAE